jgi:Glycosyl transferases group 1
MRIFLSCLQSSVNHPIPAYQFWQTYFKNGIQEADHAWVEAEGVDWAEGLVYIEKESLIEWRGRIWGIVVSSIKKQHKQKPIDLFLSYLFPKQVDSSAIQEIQQLGIPCVNFYCDNVRDFMKIPKEFYCFDLHWVPEYKALKMYERVGLKHIFAPMPVWIPLNQRNYNHPEKYGVSFIGSRDIQRELLLAQAIKSGVELEIRGAGWSKNKLNLSETSQIPIDLYQIATNQLEFIQTQGFLAWLRKIRKRSSPTIADEIFADFVKEQPNAEEYPLIIQQSLISLGINRYPSYRHPFSNPDKYSRMRDVEAPMMGSCYLTEWTEGLDHLYELGKEIETYRNMEELVEKIKYLTDSPEVRKSLRFKGQRRSLSEHTISKSINRIWKEIK